MPLQARKCHFFNKGYSLCGAWMFFGSTSPDTWRGEPVCKECQRRLDKALPKEKENG